eukprot:gnl/MRDRNA2_/MRDRNA2_82199_c0_seq1.p1 gnl/MRDRNA2_/MRDRNA2_82199_c0~~gnl/MRDRNA2_/MRDRNA2_82199_c0_seq1.p1  ORF type:complete len:1154 (-),score=174.34 gnl/MRDRNA2_/MRDRNA2_82199_c0_seq1:124-3585(-)
MNSSKVTVQAGEGVAKPEKATNGERAPGCCGRISNRAHVAAEKMPLHLPAIPKKHSENGHSPPNQNDGKGSYQPVSTVVDDDVDQSASAATSVTVNLDVNDTFVDGMQKYESLDDSLAYLDAWGAKDYTSEIKKAIIDPESAFTALKWICARVKLHPKNLWVNVWKKLCDQVILAHTPGIGADNTSNRQAFVKLIEEIMTWEYVAVARAMPNALGLPLTQGLQSLAQKLGIDVLSQFLVWPSEGMFLLWYSLQWEYRGTIRRKLHFPSQDHMLNELTKFRPEVPPAKIVTMAGKERKVNATKKMESDTLGEECGGARNLVMQHESTQTNLQSMLLDNDGDDDDEQEFHTCKSVLEALCNGYSMMKPKRQNLKRLRRVVGMVMGSEDQGLIRVITTPHFFVAFANEEEPVVFLTYVLQRLDEQQMLGHMENLEDQFNRIIRFHSNSLFTCLRIAACILKLQHRGGIMEDTWAATHDTLKKVAVQVFEMLPQASFDQIFATNAAQQSFTTLVVREAECLAMLDSPRFQDYLHARWNGLLKPPDEIHDVDDYAKYWETLVDPNTLIYSPKIRFFFNAASFIFLTIFFHFLPPDFFSECELQLDLFHGTFWSFVAGRMVAEVVDLYHTGVSYLNDIWNVADLVLVILYSTFYMLCNGSLDLHPETIKLLCGLSVSIMVLRWLQFLTPFEKFSGLIKTILLMSVDISYFLLIFSIFLTAWAVLFTRLRPDDPNYASWHASLFTFFRASLGDFDLMTLLAQAEERKYGWVETLSFIAFLLLAAVLLLNLLISIMSTTYTTVQAKGAAESAKTFLDTISEGENHDLLELGALPPPLNVVYVILLPPLLLVSLPVVLVLERCHLREGCRRYRRVCSQQIAPFVFRLILFPFTLTLLVSVSLPSFALMVIASPSIPWYPRILNVNYDFHSIWCAVRCHLLMPTARLRRIYWNLAGSRVSKKTKGVRYALYPFLAVGCVIIAAVMFSIILPADWLYETLIRGLTVSGDSHQKQLQAAKEVAAVQRDKASSVVVEQIGGRGLQVWLQDLITRGLLEIEANSYEGQLLLGEDDVEKADQQQTFFNLDAEARSWIRLCFMPDPHTLDIGMLLCFGRLKKAPDLLAAQLQRVFQNAMGHEGRVEEMLEKIYEKMQQSYLTNIPGFKK